MTTHLKRTHRVLARVAMVLFGALLIGAGPAGAAQAATTLPAEDVHIMASKGPLLSLQAGTPTNGHAAARLTTRTRPSRPRSR